MDSGTQVAMPGNTGGLVPISGTPALITETITNASTIIRAYPLGRIPPPPVNPLPPLRPQPRRPTADAVLVRDAEYPAADIVVQIVDAEYLESGFRSQSQQQMILERGAAEPGLIEVADHESMDDHEGDPAHPGDIPNTDMEREQRPQS
jgi:hypothetical protein